MIHFVTLLWDANANSFRFSKCYNEDWVLRLFNGFKRNTTHPFKFVLFTDRTRNLPDDIIQERISRDRPDYSNCIEPYRLNEPMILVGLDTVITGNIDELVEYCLKSSVIALPRDPYQQNIVCNGVALVPAGMRKVYDDWQGENDMTWMRKQPHKMIDLVFPGKVESYKGCVQHYGLRDESIVYFHGDLKPHELMNLAWIRKHWLGES